MQNLPFVHLTSTGCSTDVETVDVPALGNQSTVTEAKKKDLLWLCDELIIPSEYHSFYRELKTCHDESNSLNGNSDVISSELTVAENSAHCRSTRSAARKTEQAKHLKRKSRLLRSCSVQLKGK